MRKGIKQHDITDCAAACIAWIAKYYGRDIPITIIREASGTSCTGTSVKGIMDAAIELGFKARGYKSEEKNLLPLRGIGGPVILHTVNRNEDLHFVVLVGVGKKRVRIMDPASGRIEKKSLGETVRDWSGYIVTLEPDPDGGFNRSVRKSGNTLLAFASHIPFKDFVLMIAGSAVYIVAGICTALFLEHIIDDVLPQGNGNELVKVGLIMIAIMVCTLIIGYERVLYAIRGGIKLDGYLTLKYLRHLFRLPSGFFSRRGVGELNSRIGDVAKIRAFLITGTADIVSSILILAVSFALMFSYHSRLALLMLLFIPIYLTIYAFSSQINKRAKRDVIESSAAFEEKSVEGIGAIRMIKYFGAEETCYRGIEKQYVNFTDNVYRAGKYIDTFDTWTDGVSKAVTVTLLTAGSLFIFKGELSVGELVSFYSLTSFFSSPLGRLANISGSLSEARISAERLGEIIDLEPEGGDTIEFPLKSGQDLVFDNVSFSYPGSPSLIRNMSVTFRSGQITAVQGESGCGKSSLAALIMRDYKVKGGRILIGGANINVIDLHQWREYVSIVPQDPVLMNCSILDNVTCMDRKPDIAKAVSILEELGMKQFISELPMGILTKVGERGGILSGGQRQRIALARALYRDPQILILDEATSSLDETSERYILGKIRKLRSDGKSVIMITHKNDNIRFADKVINMSARSERSIPQA